MRFDQGFPNLTSARTWNTVTVLNQRLLRLLNRERIGRLFMFTLEIFEVVQRCEDVARISKRDYFHQRCCDYDLL